MSIRQTASPLRVLALDEICIPYGLRNSNQILSFCRPLFILFLRPILWWRASPSQSLFISSLSFPLFYSVNLPSILCISYLSIFHIQLFQQVLPQDIQVYCPSQPCVKSRFS